MSPITFEVRNSVDNDRTYKFALFSKKNVYINLEEFLKDAFSSYEFQISSAIDRFKLIKTSAVLNI